MIKKIFMVLLLLILVMVTYKWQDSFWKSATTYQSPLASLFPLPGKVLPPQTDRVVLIIISGLGSNQQQLLSLPAMQQLQESGASAIIQSSAPTYWQPAWTTLLSGSMPELGNAPLLDILNKDTTPLTVNSIIHNAWQQSRGVAITGHKAWQDFIPANLLAHAIFTHFEDAQGDEQIVNNAIELIENPAIQLLIIQFNQINQTVTLNNGLNNKAYQTAAQQIDTHLDELAALLDLTKTTLIITSDYGYTAQGGHGGDDLAVLQQPFIMVGKKVVPGNYSTIKQVDIAPTIAILLGLNIPSVNQGRPLLEMLQISNQDKAQILVALAKQHITLTESYLSTLNLTPQTIEKLKQEIGETENFLSQKNFDGATQLAELLVKQADDLMEETKINRLNKQQTPRLIGIICLLAFFLLFIIKYKTELWIDALFCGLLVVIIYHIQYQIGRNPYSLSAINNLDSMKNQIMLGIILSFAIGGFVFFALLLLRQYKNIAVILQSCYELVFFALLGFILPVLYAFWQVGLTVTWIFPNVATLFYYITGLWQTFWAASIGLFLPIIIIPLTMLLTKSFARYQQTQTK